MKIGLLCKNQDVFSLECLNKFKQLCHFDCCDLQHADKVELIVCFGGDGTTLKCVQSAVKNNAPIISVNTGNLGFLSAFTPNQLSLLCEKISSGQISYQTRGLIEVKVDNKKFYGLNEISVQRNLHLQNEAALFELSINQKKVNEYLADGIIISTPTGSTAYSYSAGGPIVCPDLKAFVATPICAHMQTARPLVYPDNQTATVTVKKYNDICRVYCDGKLIAQLQVN
ncbi:MAG: NAD(+)/NADH kinase, partial [Clostridia bacterium]|nr:NAD(+)/NADH kinase [Clostridia bacterium]